MAQPLSNLDYLIGAVKKSGEQAGSSSTEGVPAAVDRTTAALGRVILVQLQKAGGKLDAYQLVDATGIDLQTLFYVLDKLADQLRWVNVDRNDPKGNYKVELLPEGLDYMKKAGLI